MKLSNEPTDWIIMHVGHVLQFTNWYFMLLHVDNDFKGKCIQRMKLLQQLAQDERFYQISFWESPHGWYRTTPSVASVMEELIDSGQLWAYITLDDTEQLTEMALKEQEVSLVSMDIGTDGYASFTGRGTKTNSRFFSSEIPLHKILHP